MGEVLGDYELLEVIGRGSTGKVWRARHARSGRWVAVKVLREDLSDDREIRERFSSEAAVLAGRNLPGVVPVHEAVEAGERLALVMDLVDGPNLRQWLARHGPLTPTDACRLVAQVSAAVATAHEAQIVHRDLKPENVLITERGSEAVAHVTDFGLARLTGVAAQTRSSRLVGTPDYVAPEVLSGDRASGAADVYALGVILFELLTGWRPFRGASVAAVLNQHLHATPEQPEGVPDALWQLLDSLLDKAPGQRPSAGELTDALLALAASLREVPGRQRGEPPPLALLVSDELTTRIRIPRPSLPGSSEDRPSPRGKLRALVACAVGVLVLLLVGGGTMWAQAREDTGRLESVGPGGGSSAGHGGGTSIDSLESSPRTVGEPSGPASSSPRTETADASGVSAGPAHADAVPRGPDQSKAPVTWPPESARLTTGPPRSAQPTAASPRPEPTSASPWPQPTSASPRSQPTSASPRPQPTPASPRPQPSRPPGVSCFERTCHGLPAERTGCYQGAVVKDTAYLRNAESQVAATVQLYYSTLCRAYWGRIKTDGSVRKLSIRADSPTPTWTDSETVGDRLDSKMIYTGGSCATASGEAWLKDGTGSWTGRTACRSA